MEFLRRNRSDLENALQATQEEKMMVDRELHAIRSQLKDRAIQSHRTAVNRQTMQFSQANHTPREVVTARYEGGENFTPNVAPLKPSNKPPLPSGTQTGSTHPSHLTTRGRPDETPVFTAEHPQLSKRSSSY